MFRLGLIVNPVAGIGGPLALKGSDGQMLVEEVQRSGALLRSSLRAVVALDVLRPLADRIRVYCYAGAMGEDAAKQAGLTVNTIGQAQALCSVAGDTVAAARALRQQSVDLILFAGGDGTARDIYDALGDDFPVLGIPAGVKMHSGVYAISPQAAGEIVLRLIKGQLVDIAPAEVRDIDEQIVREGRVQARFYGELRVPRQGQFLQQVKSSGREVEALVLQDIAADFIESMEDDCLYLMGPGTTPRSIMDALGLDNTLLGVDAMLNGAVLALDLNEQGLLTMLDQHTGPAKIVVSVIGGQGHILGRGNQQLSPCVIRKVGLNNLIILATKTKITELQGRPLLVDTNDTELDRDLSGYREIITGYHDAIIYPVGLSASEAE
jgi:predicted polyphosphate/ATP-dependent NAD kinase